MSIPFPQPPGATWSLGSCRFCKLIGAMPQLGGVEMADDAMLGGKHRGKPGRGSDNETPFMIAVELTDESRPQAGFRGTDGRSKPPRGPQLRQNRDGSVGGIRGQGPGRWRFQLARRPLCPIRRMLTRMVKAALNEAVSTGTSTLRPHRVLASFPQQPALRESRSGLTALSRCLSSLASSAAGSLPPTVLVIPIRSFRKTRCSEGRER